MDKNPYDLSLKLTNSVNNINTQYVEVQTSIRKSEEGDSNDLFKSVRGVLVVGRVLGVIPLSGVFQHSYTKLSFRFRSFASAVSMLIISVLTVNVILAFIHWCQVPKNNALQIAYSIHRTAQYFWGWIIYVSFLRRGEKFLELFKHWAKASASVFYTVEDKTLRRDSIIICAIILVSCILENAVLHLEYFKELDYLSGARLKYKNVTSHTQSSLETYFWRSNFHWANIFGYNDFLAVLAFIQHKWMLYTWNYLDVLISIFGRALYFKFKTLYNLSSEYLTNSLKNEVKSEFGGTTSKVLNQAAWLQIVSDHRHLQSIVEELDTFFSSLIFGSYAVNLYYICIQLLIGLSPEITTSSVVQNIYGPWSFVHMAIRIYVVTFYLARINLYAHEIHKVFEDCPIELYRGEVSRLHKRITAGPPIGLTGLKCFTVRFPFFMSILTVIFTCEIVLLQGVSSDHPSTIS